MRTLAVFATLASLLCPLLDPVYGSATSHGIALGIHGPGSEWETGSPTLRWRPGASIAFDFTPTFSYSREYRDVYDYSLRLEVGCVPTLRIRDDLLLGLRIAPGYGRYFEKAGNHRQQEYSIDLCIGPDLEYFIPISARLSLGLQGTIRVRYSQREYLSWHLYADPRTSVTLLGQWLTVRYYF